MLLSLLARTKDIEIRKINSSCVELHLKHVNADVLDQEYQRALAL